MGNYFERLSAEYSNIKDPSKQWEPVESFQFHGSFSEDNTNNGLYFNNIYVPEEVVTIILSHVDPKQILKATLVCKKWCNIIKSDMFWAMIYSRHYNNKPKKLPWYVYYCLFTTDYFDKNLLRNGNGEKKYKFWKIIIDGGDGFQIENPPVGADPLPLDVPDFNGRTSCFATSYGKCKKLQEISLENSRLLRLILNKFKPHIYLSEWTAARFDCGSVYTLWCRLLGEQPSDISTSNHWHYEHNDYEFHVNNELYFVKTAKVFEQWAGSTWSKVELIAKDYPSGVKSIVFEHQGKDTQFWQGHYGSKMAGGVVKILFDSIELNA